MDSKLVHSMAELEKLFSSRMNDYEDKLQRATAGTGTTHSDLTSLSKDFCDFKSFVYKTLTHFKTQIESLSLSLDSHETYMRRKVLLFHGIPEKSGEKLSDTILHTITKQLKIEDFKLEYLNVCHRLGTPQAKTRPVLVRFGIMEHRRTVWDAKTTLKGSGITISEFLTKSRHQVFVAARKHFSINSCWSAEGKIVVLTPDKTRRKITTMGELHSLIALFPTAAGAATSIGHGSAASTSSAGGATLPNTATPKAKVLRKARR
ncbi:hypothetical protein PYW08_013030 [Mythimna loreyi]|uniref:Uncharacterized protein n=2 Tax=Mythimna loreyi TaxID=667449 RepID=A0ACC2Q186_9NEOP|nr:hypothetical protein PYW08_013029 [Mythimna loreyi]KAJ8704306.1 hypothetical protein PYW08_013030 [Mythimna loreyi]